MDQETNKPVEQNPFPAAPTTEKSPLAMIVGVVGFIIILLGVGWYMMGMNPPSTEQQLSATPTTVTPTPATTDSTQDTAAATLSAQGSSDDVNAIDADLKATDMSSLGDINKI